MPIIDDILTLESHARWLKRSIDGCQADVSSLSLVGVHLANSKLTGVQLDNVDLTGADMTDAILHRASFTGAILHRATLIGAKAYGASFSQALMQGSTLAHATFCGTDFSHTVLKNAVLPHTRLNDSDLIGADLTYAELLGTDFTNTDLRGADFTHSCMNNFTVFTGAKICRVLGNGRKIRSTFIDAYHVVWLDNQIAIEDEQHSTAEWCDFTDKDICKMFGTSNWWMRHKQKVIDIACIGS